ncbi:SEL1-like repeat protein [Aliivibrio fischeri]|uniref:SEL1-like repeat protein n=1 Tax=Aliivibrio fischeri TaxID=668 RepID=UPI001F213F67|nr:SEL1-like repeat protein [Aliivibrio fischeri]MCE7577799.1 SEL1-like repeat protein [Aliivibrio fischeri]MCE7590187.1 SEL1-like repeat protein [Aliivibrio fischeri]
MDTIEFHLAKAAIHYLSEEYSDAESIFDKLSSDGNLEGSYHLASMHILSLASKSSVRKGIELYQRAAEAGHVNSQVELGKIYYEDIYRKPNLKKAKHWFELAASVGNPEAQLNLALILLDKPDCYERVFDLLSKSSEQGNAKAKSWLAIMYHDGLGVESNKEQYFKLLKESAKQGDIGAQIDLAEHYKKGDGIRKNLKSSFKWYLVAAKQGDAEAQYEVSNCYEFGYGVDADESEKIKWLYSAAELGHIDAMFDAGLTMLNIDKDKGIEYIRCSAENHNAEAQYTLSEFYRDGEYVQKNIKKANYWFNKSQHAR